jgi:hypothetical protein
LLRLLPLIVLLGALTICGYVCGLAAGQLGLRVLGNDLGQVFVLMLFISQLILLLPLFFGFVLFDLKLE